jgi:ABC-type transport system substrate-binding protein
MNYRSVLKRYPSSSKIKSLILIGVLIFTLIGKFIVEVRESFIAQHNKESVTVFVQENKTVYHPLFSENSLKAKVLNKIFYKGLVSYNPESQTYVSDLAEFNINQDATNFTFRVKDNQFWSDGTAITIEDALFTYKNIIQNIKFTNKFLYNQFQQVKIDHSRENEMTVIIPSSNSFFIDLFTLPILPKHIYKQIKIEDFNSKNLGTFVVSNNFQKLKADSELTKIEFENKQNQNIILHIDAEKTQEYNLIVDNQEQLLEGYKKYSYLLPQYSAMFVNMERAFFKNKIHRQAIKDAVNKHDLENKIADQTIISKPFFQFDEIKSIPKTSFELIKDNLQQSQYFSNKIDNNKTIKLSLIAIKHSNEKLNGINHTLIDHISQNLNKIGIEIVPQLYDIEVFKQILVNREYDLAIFGHDLGANYDSYSFWHSSQRFQNGLNITSYYNPLTDNLLENLRRESNQNKKQDLAREINKQLNQDIPAIFLFTGKKYYFIDNQIKNRKILNTYSHTSDIFYDIHSWQKT